MIGGSPRDVCPALKTWWKQAGARREVVAAVPTLPVVPPSPDDLVSRAEMEAAIALIEERAEAERRHLMLETDRERREIAEPMRQKIERLENEILYLKGRNAALERERR